MKIQKYVTVEQEIDVDVSSEDIAAALADDPESTKHALRGINNAAQFIKAITPFMIEDMGPEARKAVAAFFYDQSVRFS